MISIGYSDLARLVEFVVTSGKLSTNQMSIGMKCLEQDGKNLGYDMYVEKKFTVVIQTNFQRCACMFT